MRAIFDGMSPEKVTGLVADVEKSVLIADIRKNRGQAAADFFMSTSPEETVGMARRLRDGGSPATCRIIADAITRHLPSLPVPDAVEMVTWLLDNNAVNRRNMSPVVDALVRAKKHANDDSTGLLKAAVNLHKKRMSPALRVKVQDVAVSQVVGQIGRVHPDAYSRFCRALAEAQGDGKMEQALLKGALISLSSSQISFWKEREAEPFAIAKTVFDKTADPKTRHLAARVMISGLPDHPERGCWAFDVCGKLWSYMRDSVHYRYTDDDRDVCLFAGARALMRDVTCYAREGMGWLVEGLSQPNLSPAIQQGLERGLEQLSQEKGSGQAIANAMWLLKKYGLCPAVKEVALRAIHRAPGQVFSSYDVVALGRYTALEGVSLTFAEVAAKVGIYELTVGFNKLGKGVAREGIVAEIRENWLSLTAPLERRADAVKTVAKSGSPVLIRAVLGGTPAKREETIRRLFPAPQGFSPT